MADNYGTLIGKAQGLPYDVSTRQAQLARKRKLAEALQLQALKDEPYSFQTGGGLAAPNFAGPLVAAMNRRRAEQMNADLDKQETAVASDVRTHTAEELNALTNSLTPKMGLGTDYTAQPDVGGMTGSLDEQDPSRPYSPQMIPAKPIEGAIRAIGSGLPGVSKAGEEIFNLMIKQKVQSGEININDLLKHPHLAVPSILEAYRTGNIGAIRAKGDVKNIDGTLVDTGPVEQGTGAAAPAGYFGPQWKPNEDRDKYTGLPTQTNVRSGETKGTTGATTPIPESQGATAFQKGMLEDYQKSLSKGKADAEAAMQRLPILKDAYGLIDNAALGKPWAEIEMTARKAGKALGWSDDKLGTISSRESFISAMAQDAMTTLEKLRPASDTDLAYAREISGGKPVTDPRTAKILVSLAISHSMNAVYGHQTNLDRREAITKGVGGLDPGMIEQLYAVPFSFKDSENYGVKMDPESKRFKSSTLAAGGAAPPPAPPAPAAQQTTKDDWDRFEKMQEDMGIPPEKRVRRRK